MAFITAILLKKKWRESQRGEPASSRSMGRARGRGDLNADASDCKAGAASSEPCPEAAVNPGVTRQGATVSSQMSQFLALPNPRPWSGTIPRPALRPTPGPHPGPSTRPPLEFSESRKPCLWHLSDFFNVSWAPKPHPLASRRAGPVIQVPNFRGGEDSQKESSWVNIPTKSRQ